MPKYTISEQDENKRLDVFLADKLNEYSRAYVQKIIKKQALVNKKAVRPSYRLRLKDQINIQINARPEIEPIHLEVIYEDNDCLVINKPAGILSHSKGSVNDESTVETFIADKLSGFEGPRAGIVHRLDRGTSGVMICAKNPDSYKWLQKQFSTRKVNKFYSAVVLGNMANDEAIIDMPIGRNPKSPATFRVNANGKESITAYKVDKTSKNYSLLSLNPRTGRTHQLRVHLSYLGHPILGDTLYKGQTAERLYLHAKQLEILLPNLTKAVFKSDTPKEFGEILKNDHD